MNPFEVGRATANAIGKGFQGAQDRTAIDEILETVAQTGDENLVDNAIGQIIQRVSPERQSQAMAVLQAKKNKILQNKQLNQQKSHLKKLGLPEELAGADKSVIVQALRGKQLENKQQGIDQQFNRITGQGQPNTVNTQPPSAQRTRNPFMQLAQAPGQPAEVIQDTAVIEESPPGPTNEAGFKALSDNQLVSLTALPGYSEPAKQELKRRQEERTLNQKEQERKIKRNEDISMEAIKSANKTAESLPQRRSALDLSRNAIANKDLSFWTGDNLAELTGIEGFRSTEGAIFKTAGKEYFLGSIGRAGVRPNMWVEQQIADMLTKIGRSTEANLSVTRALENELDLDQAKVDITNRLADELEEKLGYIPRDLSARVQKELSVFAEEKQKELYNDLRAMKSIGEKQILSFNKVKEGTPVSKVVAKVLLKKNKNDPKKAAQEAKQLGYAF